jgi:hypothetical protein
MNEEEKTVLELLKQTTKEGYEKMSAEEKRAFGEKTRICEHPFYVANCLRIWHNNLNVPEFTDEIAIESWKLYCRRGAWK